MSLLRPEDLRPLIGAGLVVLLGLIAPRSGASAPAGAQAAPARAWDAALDAARAIDVNRAHASELERLPGVGRILAGRIVAERDARGRFTGAQDLLRVSGIGPKTLETIEPYITFE